MLTYEKCKIYNRKETPMCSVLISTDLVENKNQIKEILYKWCQRPNVSLKQCLNILKLKL